MVSAIVIYLAIGFMVMEIGLSPDDPNLWRTEMHRMHRGRAFAIFVMVCWPPLLVFSIIIWATDPNNAIRRALRDDRRNHDGRR